MMKDVSIRSIVLGLLLGAAISAATYFNDFVIRQDSLIKHLLPVSVLGFGLLLVGVINPLLAWIRPGRSFRPAEIAVVIALGLVACTIPGAGFFRTAPSSLVMPQYRLQTSPAWQSQGVMSYVPGGSAQLTQGQISDWPSLIEATLDPDQSGESILVELNATLTDDQRQMFQRAQTQQTIGPSDGLRLLRAYNHALQQLPLDAAQFATAHPDAPGWIRLVVERASHDARDRLLVNRWRLTQALPGVVAAMPPNRPILISPDDHQHAMALVLGDPKSTFSDFDWQLWWPTLRLWSLAAIALGLCSLCLALIVHRQWSQHELLSYPIPRFIREMLRRDEHTIWPAMFHHRLFWGGAISVFFLHALSAVNAWGLDIPQIPRNFDFNALRTLFPTAARNPELRAYLLPWFFFTVIALAYFLNRTVSFSLGIAPLCWIVLATFMNSWGVVMDNEYLGAGRGNMLRFGAFLGMAAVIFYAGRRYYLQVACAAVGLPTGQRIRGYEVWAARSLGLFTCLAVWFLSTSGMGWLLAVVTVMIILLMFVVIARIVAETGLFFIQPYWMPVGVLTALLGFEAIGPSLFVTLAIASVMLVGDTRTALLANAVNGLKMVEDSSADRRAVGRISPWLALMFLAGFVIAAAATLWVVQKYGLMGTDGFTREILPAMPFDALTAFLSNAEANGTLRDAVFTQGLDRASLIQPIDIAIPWTLAGLILVLAVSIARLRLPWWPIHPVIFLIRGTFPSTRFAASFLAGWAIKSVVVTFAGARGFQTLIPLMVGFVAGDLIAAVFWLSVGTIYYVSTGQQPPIIRVF